MWSSDDYPIDEVHTSPKTLQIGNWIIEGYIFLSTANPKKGEAKKTNNGYIIEKGKLVIVRGNVKKRGTHLTSNERKKEYRITKDLTLVLPK